MPVLLGSDILVGYLAKPKRVNLGMRRRKGDSAATDQVHPVPRARNQTRIRNGVHGGELLKRHRLVHEVDGHELDRSKPAVDPADELVNRRPEVLVLLDVLTRGDGKLNEDDLRERMQVKSQTAETETRSERPSASSPFRSTPGAQSGRARGRAASEAPP